MTEPVIVFTIYLPDFEVVAFIVGFLALYILVRTALKITPFVG